MSEGGVVHELAWHEAAACLFCKRAMESGDDCYPVHARGKGSGVMCLSCAGVVGIDFGEPLRLVVPEGRR